MVSLNTAACLEALDDRQPLTDARPIGLVMPALLARYNLAPPTMESEPRESRGVGFSPREASIGRVSRVG